MLKDKRYSYLVEARYLLTRFLVAEALRNIKLQSITYFIKFQIVLFFSVLIKVIIDRRSEFKKDLIAYIKDFGIKRVKISIYNAKANKIAKQRHIPLA